MKMRPGSFCVIFRHVLAFLRASSAKRKFRVPASSRSEKPQFCLPTYYLVLLNVPAVSWLWESEHLLTSIDYTVEQIR